MGVYSFQDVQAAISGPGGVINLGSDAGVGEEGITVAMTEEKDTMTIGADGSGMHSLHAAKSGTISVRLLKTSPINRMLNQMYLLQTVSSAYHGQNVISIRDPVRGDNITATEVAFRRLPDNVNAKVGGTMDWVFNCIHIDEILGNGQPSLT